MACNNYEEDSKEHNADAAVLLCWLLRETPVFETTPVGPDETKLREWWGRHQAKDRIVVMNKLTRAQRTGYDHYLSVLTGLTAYEKGLVFGLTP